MKARQLVIFTSLPEVGGHTTTTIKLCELLRPMFEQICVLIKDIPGHGFSEPHAMSWSGTACGRSGFPWATRGAGAESPALAGMPTFFW